MTLNVLDIEELLKQEGEHKIQLLQNFNHNYQSYKQTWKCLKDDFISKGTEAEFYKLISSFSPPQYTVANLEQKKAQVIAERDKILDSKDQQKEINNDTKEVLKAMFNDMNLIQDLKQDLIENIKEAREKELLYNQILNKSLPTLMKKTKNDNEKDELLASLRDKKLKLDNLLLQQQQTEAIQKEEFELLEKDLEKALEQESDAIKMSDQKDPIVEELGNFYKHSAALIKQYTMIKQISLTDFLTIEYKGHLGIKMELSVKKDINIKVNIECNFDDIIENSKNIKNLQDKIAFVVEHCERKVLRFQERNKEMQELVDQHGAIYEEAVGELLIQSEVSQRAFVLLIDSCYPYGGVGSVTIVGIEPLGDNESVSDWNLKLKSTGAKSVTDIYNMLL